MKDFKILYVVDYCPSFNSGIGKKLRSQLKYLNKTTSTELLFLSDSENDLEWRTTENVITEKVFISSRVRKSRLFRPYRVLRRKHRRLLSLDYIADYNCIYYRYKFCTPELVKFGKMYDHLVFEINGHLFEEVRSSKRGDFSVSGILHNLQFYYLKKYTEFRLASKLMNYQRAISFVSNELSEIAALEWKLKDGIEIIVQGNGFETSLIEPRKYVGLTPDRLRILLLKGAATDAPYLGLNRVLDGLSSKEGLDFEIEFSFCGKHFEGFESKVKNLGIDHLFHFKGFLKGKELDYQLDHCDIAIGTLSPRLNEISSLKAREYYTAGIPFVYGYKDTDIESDSLAAEYCISVPNDGTPLNFNEIYSKLSPVLLDENHPKIMNKIAQEMFSMELKMLKLSKKLKEIYA